MSALSSTKTENTMSKDESAVEELVDYEEEEVALNEADEAAPAEGEVKK